VTDSVSKLKRSQVMAAIRSSGNRVTELRFVTLLKAHRITGWRRHKRLVGRPDFVFPKEKLAVFVDGCFWHGCQQHCRMPKSRNSYWNPKIVRNKQRDKEVRKILTRRGWRVMRIWEHALKRPRRVLARLQVMLDSHS
jgi:DNA mismatch endonuclease (patch repair protein)